MSCLSSPGSALSLRLSIQKSNCPPAPGKEERAGTPQAQGYISWAFSPPLPGALPQQESGRVLRRGPQSHQMPEYLCFPEELGAAPFLNGGLEDTEVTHTLTAPRGRTKGCPIEGRLGGAGWIDPTLERLRVARCLLDFSMQESLMHQNQRTATLAFKTWGFSGWSKDPQIISFHCLTSPLSNAQQAINSKETRNPPRRSDRETAAAGGILAPSPKNDTGTHHPRCSACFNICTGK